MARTIVDGGEEFALTDEQINAAIKDLKNQIVTSGHDPLNINTTTLEGILAASAVKAAPPSTTSAAQFRAAEAAAGSPVMDVNGNVLYVDKHPTQTEQDIVKTLTPVKTPSAADVRAADVVASSSVTGVTPTPTEIAIAKDLGPGKIVTPEGIVDKTLPYGVGGDFGKGGGSTGGSGGGATVPVVTPVVKPVTPAVDPNAALRKSAYDMLKDALESWGLGGLTQWAYDTYTGVNAPTSYNEFYLLLKQQDLYKERFGNTNAMRVKAGLPALSENEIMKTESTYKKILSSYGLPASFYDDPKDYQQFLVNDLSASEVADRVQAANSYVKLQNPQVLDQLNKYYGIDAGALTAAQLDPARGQEILTNLASKNTAAIAAATAGMSVDQAQFALGMGAGELSFQKQSAAFAQANEMGTRGSQLSDIYGTQNAPTYGTQEALTESFNGATAYQETQKRKTLGKMETNLFSGSSGVDKTSLLRGDTAGAL